MEEKVKLEVTIQQLNILMSGIAKLPIEMGLATFTELQKQADSQLKSNRAEGPLSGKVLN